MAGGDVCTACFVGTLQLHEGMLVCDVCGSIAQGFAEEAQEYQVGISDARYFKKSEGMARVGSAAKAEAAEPPPPPPVEEAVRAYVRAVQALLQRQVQALVEAFGLDPALSPALRELWLALLAHSRLLEPATLARLQAVVEQGGAGSDEDTEPTPEPGVEEGEEGLRRNAAGRTVFVGGHMSHTRRSVRMQAELAPLLRLQHTLFLLLLACYQQQEAVSPLDLARWALDGRLPYLSFGAQEGAALRQFRGVLGPKLLSPTGVGSPFYLQAQAAELAAALGLRCPPLNAPLLLQRYLTELELPQELLPLALELQRTYHPVPPPPCKLGRPMHHPWAKLMAVLVVAAKLCYGLDGRRRGVAGAPPPPAWAAWARRQALKFGRLSAFPLTTREAAQLDDGGLREYLAHLQQGLFSTFAPPAELESTHRLFQRLALPPNGAPPGPGGASGAAAAAAAANGARGGQGEAPGPDAPAVQRQQQRQQPGREPEPPQQVLQQQQQAPYAFYGSASGASSLFHPDYVALLGACAPLVWLQPEGLHEVVAALERRVIAAECEVSYWHNAAEQARLARLAEEGALLRMRGEGQAGEPRMKRRQPAVAGARAGG